MQKTLVRVFFCSLKGSKTSILQFAKSTLFYNYGIDLKKSILKLTFSQNNDILNI